MMPAPPITAEQTNTQLKINMINFVCIDFIFDLSLIWYPFIPGLPPEPFLLI